MPSAGENKQRSTQRAFRLQGTQSIKTQSGAPSDLWAALGKHAIARRGAETPPLRRVTGTVARPRRGPGPTMPHCSARAACETPGESVFALPAWTLLSYQRRRHNRPGVLTILPSGESKPWPGSKLAGETCCRTAWLLVTMAPLPWWLMVPEDAASPLAAWLYRTPAKHRQALASPMGTPARVPRLCQPPLKVVLKRGNLPPPPHHHHPSPARSAQGRKRTREPLNDTLGR